MNAIAPVNTGLVPASMGEAMKLAEMMASAKLVPKDLQKSPADCLMVIQQAVRWQMDPFAVAQECSVIQGKLMHSGKLVAAVVNARGNLAERLFFVYEGDGSERTIRVIGKLRGETEPREVTVKLGDAKTNNRVWQSQPDQQLMYHGCRVWARRHTPELMLGVWSPEEFDETQQPANGNGAVVIEHEPVRKSSAAAKRNGDWQTLQSDLMDVQSAVGLQSLWNDYHANVYPTWNKDWQREADQEFEAKMATFSQPEHLAETLADAVEVEARAASEDFTKADYVQHCHAIIEAAEDEKALLGWWNSRESKDKRREHELTKEEVQALMTRVMEKREQLVGTLAAG